MQPVVKGAASKQFADALNALKSLPAQLEQFATQLDVCERLDAIEVRLDKIERDHTEPALVRDLQEQRDKFQQDLFYKHFLARVHEGLVRLLDRLLELHTSFEEIAMPSKSSVLENLLGLITEVKQTLEKEGLTVEQIPAGSEFDPDCATVVKVLPVEDENLDGKVLRVVRPLVRYGRRVIREAEVVIGANSNTPKEVRENGSHK